MYTHLIAKEPSKTEKFLCAVASGKWILFPTYITDSFKAKKWLDESDYEWSPSNLPKDLLSKGEVRDLCMAVKKHRENGGKPFRGWICKVLLKRGTEGLINILRAGGAIVQGNNDEESTLVCKIILLIITCYLG